MYELLSFTNGSTNNVYTDMNEALNKSSELVVNPVEATVGDIAITSSGLIDFGGEQRQTTRVGFESYCKLLGIPPQFGRHIPEDLLLHNIERLSKDRGGDRVTLLERNDGTFASIVKSPYKEIPYIDILSRFIDRNNIKKVEISEELMKIVFTFEELKVPNLDDRENTLYIGDYVLSSLIKETSLHAVAGLFRTQCDNSFIMPVLGRLKANYLKVPEKRLELFAQAFECYDSDLVATIFRNVSNSVNKHIKKHQFKHIWERYGKILGKTEADQLFSINEDQRKLLLAEASSYISETKKARALGQVVLPPEDTVFECYNIANQITTVAHQRLDGIDSVKAETLGGTILQWMIFLN